MAATPTLRGKITLDDNPFQAGLRRAKTAGLGFARGFGGGVKRILTSALLPIAGILGGIIGVRAFAGGIKGALDLGSSMVDLKAQTGASIDELLVFQQVLKDNGVPAESLRRYLNKMQQAVVQAAGGSKLAAKGFAQIGLRAEDLLKLNPVQQFRAVADALGKIQDPAKRSAAAMQIFGKSGGALLGVLANAPSFEEAAKSIGRQAQILKDNAQIFDDVSDRLGRAPLKLQGFFIGVASGIAPLLDALTAKFDSVDLASQGEKFAVAMRTAANYITGAFENPGAMLDAFANAILGAEATALNFLANGLLRAAAGFASAMLRAVDDISRLLYTGLLFSINQVMSKIPGSGVKAQTFAQIAKSTPEGMAGKAAGVADVFANAPMADIFGAAGFLKAAKKAAGDVELAGEELLDSILRDWRPQVKETVKPWAAINKTLSDSGGLKTGGLGPSGFADAFSLGRNKSTSGFDLTSSALNKGAFNQSPLLSSKERRAFEDAGVAKGGARGASAGAFGAVRSGDSARRKAELKEEEKKKLGIEQTNSLLEDIKSIVSEGVGE